MGRGGAAALACAFACAPGATWAQTGNRPAASEPVPQAGLPAQAGRELPADILLQLPRSNARPYGPVDDPLLYRSRDRSGGVQARDEGALQLSANPPQQEALAASARPVSRTADDLKPRGYPVLTRRRTDYDPVGIRTNGFTVFPSFTASANATSNVYLQPTGRDDVFGTARAAVVARSTFNRHAANIDGFVEGVGYGRSGSENGVSYLAHANGRFDVAGRDTLSFDVSRERRLVDRSAVGETITTRSPVRFNRSISEISGQLFRGRTSLDLRAGITKLDFVDAQTLAGNPFDEDYRDYNNYGISALVAYELGYSSAFYVSASQDWQRARLPAVPRRDLQRTEFLGGLRGEITPLITGHAALGYLQISFPDPTIRTKRQAAVDVRLDYMYSQLTTFTLSARRTLQNVASFTTPGTVVTATRLGVDHELYRNLILSAGAVYSHADYVQGQDADLWGFDLAAQYLIDRKWQVRVSAAQRSRTTQRFENFRGFDAVTTGIGFTYQL